MQAINKQMESISDLLSLMNEFSGIGPKNVNPDFSLNYLQISAGCVFCDSFFLFLR